MEPERKIAEQPSARQAEIERLDALLDEALMDTFPASDPVAITPRRDRAKKAGAGEPPSS
jgi:hypothetical protein